jgi:hypothetical protein
MAKKWARRFHWFGTAKGRPYLCPHCGEWHLTTVGAERRAELRRRVREGAM